MSRWILSSGVQQSPVFEPCSCRSTLTACMQCVGSLVGEHLFLTKTRRQSLNIRKMQKQMLTCRRQSACERLLGTAFLTGKYLHRTRFRDTWLE